tara:strand:+ start:242 stop:490 length:249 start_codon:yes stop_codon:yes gene_type:complete
MLTLVLMGGANAHDDSKDPVGLCMDIIASDPRTSHIYPSAVAKFCRNASKSTPSCMRRVMKDPRTKKIWPSAIAEQYCSPTN